MNLHIDYLPAHCGVEVDRGMVRAVAEDIIEKKKYYSKWKDLPEDLHIRWAEFEWPNT